MFDYMVDGSKVRGGATCPFITPTPACRPCPLMPSQTSTLLHRNYPTLSRRPSPLSSGAGPRWCLASRTTSSCPTSRCWCPPSTRSGMNIHTCVKPPSTWLLYGSRSMYRRNQSSSPPSSPSIHRAVRLPIVIPIPLSPLQVLLPPRGLPRRAAPSAVQRRDRCRQVRHHGRGAGGAARAQGCRALHHQLQRADAGPAALHTHVHFTLPHTSPHCLTHPHISRISPHLVGMTATMMIATVPHLYCPMHIPTQVHVTAPL